MAGDLVGARPACAQCGNPLTKKWQTRFCSIGCSNRAGNESRRTYPNFCRCIGCGVEYPLKRSNGQGLKYCSRECANVHLGVKRAQAKALRLARLRLIRLLRSRRTCPQCGSVFGGNPWAKYCSDACGAEAARHNARAHDQAKDKRDRSPRACGECGTVFAPAYGNKRNRFCSATCMHRNLKRIAKATTRARMRAAPQADAIDPMTVFERDGWRCQLCGQKTLRTKRGTTHPRAPEMDHIHPLSDGGPHVYDNVQCACRECNGRKAAGLGGQLIMFGRHSVRAPANIAIDQ